MTKNSHIGILTCEGYEEYKLLDRDLITALTDMGFTAKQIVWTQPQVKWSDFHAIVVLSTWDYFETSKKCEKFLKLLEEINKHQIKLVNPIETIEWNYKKTYLRDLEKIGVPIIDTLWVKKNQLGTVASLIKKKEWEKMVIKPVISGGGLHAQVFHANDLEEIVGKCNDKDVDQWMIQSFAEEITSEGEHSFIFVGTECTHAILKKPKKGNFLVQPFHGGTYTDSKLFTNPEMMSQANNIISKINREFIFARLDTIARNNKLMVSEIEMIEPLLFHENVEGFMGKFLPRLLAYINC